MRSNNTIYSLHTQPDSSGLLHIETVITGGIYNFSILGIASKYASDIKSRVYTALRTEGLLNLKSDNRKITTNIIADREEVVPNSAELAIAISCIQCISGNVIELPTLILGGLSITGTIIPTNRLLQAIYLAMTYGFKRIVCSNSDVLQLDTEYIEYAYKHGIRFVIGTSLKDIVDNLRSDIYHSIQPGLTLEKVRYPEQDIRETLLSLKESYLQWSIFVALCGRHNIMVESNNAPHIEELIDILGKYIPLQGIEEKFFTAHRIRMEDSHYQQKTKTSFYSKIPAHTTKRPLKDELASFTYLENILSLGVEVFGQYYADRSHQLISTCQYCPCGHLGSYTKKCLCIQRFILRYQHKLNTEHKSHYEMWVSHHTHSQQPFQPLEKPKVLTYIIETVRSEHNTIPTLDPKAQKMKTQLSESLNMRQKEILLSVAKTLQLLSNLEHIKPDNIKRPTVISTKNLLLAFSYLPKMDF